jgi:hypothetical protein
VIKAAVFTLFPATFFLGAVYWARGGVAARTPGAWAITTLLTSFGVSFVAYNPWVRAGEDSLTPLLSHLISNSGTLSAAASVAALLVVLNAEDGDPGPGLRPRLVFLGLALAVMLVTISLTPVSQLWVTQTPAGSEPAQPLTLTIYSIVYILYLSYALVDCVFQSLRRARSASRQSIRIGLRMVAAGCATALVYVGFRILTIVTALSGTAVIGRDQTCTSLVTPADCAFAVTTPALSALLVTVGLTMPVITWKVQQLQRRRWERNSTLAITPLWTVLTEAMPDVVLHEIDQQSTVSDLVLHRRVIEILDGILRVSAYRSRLVQDRATQILTAQGHPADTVDALVEAAVLVDALRAMRNDEPREADPAPSAPGTHDREGDLRAEVQWLRAVAKAFVNTPHQPPTPDTAQA